MEVSSSSSSSTAILCVVTVIIAVGSVLALNTLNSLWLRPKRFEKLLRAQGLHGDPYSLSPPPPTKTTLHKTCILLDLLFSPMMLLLASSCRLTTLSPNTKNELFAGKNSFLWEGTTPKVIITDPNHTKEVFNNIHDFQKQKISNSGKFFFCGLISYEGDKWAQHRKIINPAFNLEKLKNMLPAFFQSCNDVISVWMGMLSSDGKCEIDVSPFLQKLTCDVISRTAFGSSYAEGEKIFQLFRIQGRLIMTAKYTNKPILRHIPTLAKMKMRAADKEIKSSLRVMIEKREKAMKNGESCNEDLLGILVESNQMEIQGNGNNKSVGITIEEVITECKLFYIAGQETTSSLLVWTLIMLSKYPEWQARAREEVLHVFGKNNPNFDGLSLLKTMTMIQYEVPRLYPPNLYFNRTLKKDMELGNLSLPAGVDITMPILLVHQDGDIRGNDAKEFKPKAPSDFVPVFSNNGAIVIFFLIKRLEKLLRAQDLHGAHSFTPLL
ncbi:hypothetical protein ACSQ67_023892 [Phaseolus vulgaris]